jgi:hypothetical protein
MLAETTNVHQCQHNKVHFVSKESKCSNVHEIIMNQTQCGILFKVSLFNIASSCVFNN